MKTGTVSGKIIALCGILELLEFVVKKIAAVVAHGHIIQYIHKIHACA